MRTTVDLSSEHIEHVKRVTGKQRLTEALREMIDSDLRKRRQLELIELLIREKPPHDWKKIKAQRKMRKWNA